MDFGIEAVTRYPSIAYYGRIWLVEFRDYTNALVIEDGVGSLQPNFVIEPEEGESCNTN